MAKSKACQSCLLSAEGRGGLGAGGKQLGSMRAHVIGKRYY